MALISYDAIDVKKLAKDLKEISFLIPMHKNKIPPVKKVKELCELKNILCKNIFYSIVVFLE